MLQLDALLTNIMVELPGCSEPLARQVLVRVASEFCARTLLWSEVLEPVGLVEGERDCEIDVPADAYMVSVQSVWCDQQLLTPATPAELQLRMPNWRDATGTPTHYNRSPSREVLSVYPRPSKNGEMLQVAAAFSLLPKARSVPDLFLDAEYFDALCAGAKARLMAMPGQNWSAPQLAQFYMTQFENGVSAALAEVAHGGVAGPLIVQPRRFL